MKLAHAALAAALAVMAGSVWSPPVAMAQSYFSGSTPVFQSDIEKRQREAEAQRAARAKSHPPTRYPAFMKGGEKPEIAPEKPPIVYLDRAEEPGSIIIDTNGRKLYFVLPNKQAYAYPISVGRDGFTWTGTERISRIASWPSWTPPSEMRQRQPGLPVTVTGGLINPLGAKALYLGSSIYRIHGTNNDRSIGRANSSGCFRLTNAHVIHLASIARVGTKVTVVSNYAGGVSQGMPLSALFGGFGASDDKPAVKGKKTKVKSKATKAKAKNVKVSGAQ